MSPAPAPRPRRRPAAALSRLTPLLAGLTALLASAAAPTPAAGAGVLELAELPLEGLLDLPVTGASRLPQRMSEAAASVSVISGDELRALGYRTLADALGSLRGLDTYDDRSYRYLGVRGFYAPGDYNTRVLLLVDGHRANDMVYDQAMLGSEAPVDIEQVERIEFVPGQGSAVYGANALFGVVNVVTRRPGKGPGGAALRLGGDGERELQATWQQRLGDGAWLVSASRLVRAGGSPEVPAVDAGTDGGSVRVPGIDHEQVNRVRLAAQGRQWQAQLLHLDRTKGIGAPVDVVPDDRRNTNRDTTQLADLSWRAPLPSGEWTARLFAGRYRFVGTYVIDGEPVSLNRDDDQGRWWGTEWRLTTRAWAGHQLQLGAELQQSTQLRLVNADVGAEDAPYLDLSARARRLGVYAEDQVDLGRGWTAVLGLRHDRSRATASQWSPRVALLWRASPHWVFKALHGAAFRPPNAFERDYEVPGPGGYLRNPELRPERVKGQELVAEWTPHPAWRVTMAAYRTHASDLIVLHPVPDAEVNTFRFDNAGSTRLRGLELEAQWVGPRGWRLRSHLSLVQTPSGASGGQAFVAASATRMAKATLVAPLAAGWTLGLDGRARSRRGEAGGHALIDAHLAGPLGHGLQFGLRLSNLLDRRHADPGSVPEVQPQIVQDGRRWSARLAWTF